MTIPRWLLSLSWRLRKLRRIECWWRGKHRGFWLQGRWICRRCAKQFAGAPPVGTHVTDEPAKHVYVVGERGELRRVDKVRGDKKYRKKHRDEVERVERI